MDATPEAPGEGVLIKAAAALYAVMTAVGVVLLALQDIPVIPAIFGHGSGLSSVAEVGVGAGCGLAVVGISWLLRDLPAVKRLSEVLGGQLGEPSTRTIALLAITSAIGEEVCFRGGLQPLIGFWPTAFVFGIIHGGTARWARIWVVFAVLAGLMLGWLAERTGNLVAPIICHLTINYWNLHAMTIRTPSGAGPAGEADDRESEP